jgi:hypothetical protein
MALLLATDCGEIGQFNYTKSTGALEYLAFAAGPIPVVPGASNARGIVIALTNWNPLRLFQLPQ